MKKEKNQSKQYDKVGPAYVSLVGVDPAKIYVQFPEALRLLGDIKGKRVLDIGCGNGIFSQMLARSGAIVEGYDPSRKQIAEAKIDETENKYGIHYYVSDHPKGDGSKFNCAVAILVLMYAASKQELEKMFTDAYSSLKKGGKFVALTFNPNFKRLGQIAHNRRWTKTGNGKMMVDFFQKGELKLSANFSDFSTDDYEDAARKAGFNNFSWEKLSISPEGIKAAGKKFWQGFNEDPSYVGIKIVK